MEAAFVNLLECGDKVIVCQNGVFGGRMKENVERCGATAVMVWIAGAIRLIDSKLRSNIPTRKSLLCPR